MEEKSYTNPDFGAYKPGYLLDHNINKLSVYQIEVWGIGT